MFKIHQSVRRKLMMVVLITTTSALLFSSAATVSYELKDFRRKGINDLTALADVIGLAAAPSLALNDPAAAREYLQLLETKAIIRHAVIYRPNGAMFASYSQEAHEFAPLPRAEGHYIEGNELMVFSRIIRNGEILGTIGLRAEHNMLRRLRDYVVILGTITLLSLVGSLLLSGWLQQSFTDPIVAVTKAAERVVALRDYSQRVAKTTGDEIGTLVDAFNGMLREIETRSAELRMLNTDLEGRVAARTAMLEAANKDLESFSYSVSHDLRAPLRAITGFAGLLWKDHKDLLNGEAQRKLSIICTQADRMGNLIDDLLAFARLGRKALVPTAIDMSAMARAVYERSAPQDRAIDFEVGQLPSAVADRNLIEQVWANLISNAIKFTSKIENPVVNVGAIVEQTENVYYVSDNGAGFEPRYADKLFGVFQRLHTEEEFPGTGVGLALVQRIISRHGGRVWADGKPGGGAAFYFSLPREPL